jgi:Peptidoglycan-synthase activator LpoB
VDDEEKGDLEMNRATKTAIILGLLALPLWGCSDYGDQRPDPAQLNSGDSGLQSKDVVACTNQLVTDLLSSPQLNASPTQWTLVVTGVQDETIDRMFATNYDIFTESLRSAISEKAQGRIALIENKATFNNLRSSELEGNSDPYGQGGSPNQPAPQAVNPDYILYGKAIDMPNRSTNFYLLQFNIVNAHTRIQVWSRTYQVKVAR